MQQGHAHRALSLFEIARMPQTLHFVQILWARYPFDLINQLKGRVSRAAQEHEDLLQAFIAKDYPAPLIERAREIARKSGN